LKSELLANTKLYCGENGRSMPLVCRFNQWQLPLLQTHLSLTVWGLCSPGYSVALVCHGLARPWSSAPQSPWPASPVQEVESDEGRSQPHKSMGLLNCEHLHLGKYKPRGDHLLTWRPNTRMDTVPCPVAPLAVLPALRTYSEGSLHGSTRVSQLRRRCPSITVHHSNVRDNSCLSADMGTWGSRTARRGRRPAGRCHGRRGRWPRG
jgi:hypothetical protein